MSRRTWRVTALLIAGLLFAGSRFLPPILLVLREPGAVDPGDVVLVVRNPLRNRGAERAAAGLLRELRSGNCANAFPFFDASLTARLCESEEAARVQSWSVVNRKDIDRESKIQFKVMRSGYPPRAWGNVWVTVTQDRGGYRVSDYDAWY
jgi:hypothetical protein